MLQDEKLLMVHRERIRARRVWPIVKPKPRTLSVRFGRDVSYGVPDMIFSHGEGCGGEDATFLYYVLSALNVNAEFNENRRFQGTKPPLPRRSILDELAVRGYDITTLRFEIQKLPDPEPLKQPEYIPNYEI